MKQRLRTNPKAFGDMQNVTYHNYAVSGMKTAAVAPHVAYIIQLEDAIPDFILVHVGTNDFEKLNQIQLKNAIVTSIVQIVNTVSKHQYAAKCKGIIFSGILPRRRYNKIPLKTAIKKVKAINGMVRKFLLSNGNWYLSHLNISPYSHYNFRKGDNVHLSTMGITKFVENVVEKIAQIIRQHRK